MKCQYQMLNLSKEPQNIITSINERFKALLKMKLHTGRLPYAVLKNGQGSFRKHNVPTHLMLEAAKCYK